MKKLATIAVCVLAVFSLGSMQIQDKFTIAIYNWFGLDSDELFSVDLVRPNDTWNIEIGNEGGRTYIQQRLGTERILGKTPAGNDVRAIQIVQFDIDTERVVVYASDGNVYQTIGDGTWYDIMPSTVNDTFVSFLQFKDTLLFSGGGNVYLSTLQGGGTFDRVRTDTAWYYDRLLLHQDRVYAWSAHAATNTEFRWNAEFDINFNEDHYDSQVALGNAGFAYIDKDGGDFLTNMLPLGEHIMAYMSRTIYKVLISPTANIPVEIFPYAENVGAYGYDAVIAYNNMHYFVAEDGVYENNGSSVKKLSEAIDYWFKDSLVHSNGQARVFKLAVYDNKLFVTLPKKDGSSPSDVGGYREFVYDFDTETWTKWRLTSHDGFDQQSHWMLRYEYNPFAKAPLTGGQWLKQRLIFVRDSSDAVQKDVFWIYPSDDYLSDGGSVFHSQYKTALAPLTSLANRKRLERMIVFGTAKVGASDSALTNYIIYFDESGNLDSNFFHVGGAGTVSFLRNYRVSPKVTGDMLGLKIVMRDTNRVKINAIELVGSEPGPGDETP